MPAKAPIKAARNVEPGDVKLFNTKKAWAAWLDRNHRSSKGMWLQIAKKDSGLRSVSYGEALEVALCYGWIDAQKKAHDEASWIQRFAPRSKSSLWSKVNREKAEALIAAGEMKPAGLTAIEQARHSGRWENAYDSQRTASTPSDFQAVLESSPRAQVFFEKLDKANRYAVLWRIQTAKTGETRARKIAQFVAMFERGEKIHE
jgi:uncharacterized protein YdeI (YjbR/CyaY-like superfamily)